MIIKHNVDIGKICWLNLPGVNMGKIQNLYYPETVDELVEVCRALQKHDEPFYVFGHMSNSYFKNTFTPPHVVITSKLRCYNVLRNCVVCDCGASIRQVARRMVDEGVEGFDGLWDLPGTVASAVYGNSGCFGCEMSDIFHSAEILTPQGEIKVVTPVDLNFVRRNSNIKKGILKGGILRVTLKKVKGNAADIQKRAMRAHHLRETTQPGPQNNLGSCFMSGERRLWYRIMQRLVRMYLKQTGQNPSSALALELKLLGHRRLVPYLFEMNRFIWKDAGAVDAFEEYVSLYKKLYKGAKLEINVFE